MTKLTSERLSIIKMVLINTEILMSKEVCQVTNDRNKCE